MFFLFMEKRGLHSVIVTVLIISVALVSAVLLWAAIKAFYAESTEGVDVKVFTVGVEIVPKTLRSVSLGDSVGLSFYVRAGKGEGEIVALNVAAEDSGGNSKNYKYLFPKGNLKAYESEKVSVSYEGLKEITEVTVSAIFKNEEGKEIESKMSSVYKVKDSEGGASVTIGGLVGYWKFDELKGDIARDFSGNKFSANLKPSESGPSRAAKSSECVQNGCLFMDGTDDYLEVPYNEKLNPKKFSVMAWVKPVSSRESYQTVLVSQNPESENKGLVLYTNPSNEASANVWQGGIIGGSKLSAVGGAIKSNEWVHLAMVYDGSKVSVYENGKIVPETQAYRTAGDYLVEEALSYGETWAPKEELRSWIIVKVSSDGKYQTAITGGDRIYTSSDFGDTWTVRDSVRNRNNLVMSGDGKYQIVAGDISSTIPGDSGSIAYDSLYVSSDFGVNWVENRGAVREGYPNERDYISYFYDLGMSLDGKYQTGIGSGRIFISSDYGNSWISSKYGGVYQPDGEPWYLSKLAVSGDGRYQTIIGAFRSGSYSMIYLSSDFGKTWTLKKFSGGGFFAVGMSENGKNQIILGNNKIYLSSDNGANWAEKTAPFRSGNIAISKDGKYQTAASSYQIYRSEDTGATWTAIGGTLLSSDYNNAYLDVKMSADGKYQTALAKNRQIYTSSDYGVTWKMRDSNREWKNLAMSKDGKYQTAVVSAWQKGNIYVSKPLGSQASKIPAFFNIGAASTIQKSQQTPGMFFNGYLDEVMVFEKELT